MVAKTVGELKKLIENLPDQTRIVVPAPDHSFRFAKVGESTIMYDRASRSLHEDFGDQPDESYVRVTVLVVEWN